MIDALLDWIFEILGTDSDEPNINGLYGVADPGG